MDTRFWGPSGWKLLHLICEDYQYSAENAVRYAEFFETIPYILPCKFCRASLTDYYRLHPYQLANSHMSPTLDLSKWIYTIHNCVNDKLRKQGFCKKRNPSFSEVKCPEPTKCPACAPCPRATCPPAVVKCKAEEPDDSWSESLIRPYMAPLSYRGFGTD